VTVKHQHGRWFCIVTAEPFAPDWFGRPDPADLRPDAGGDPGLATLMTDSHRREASIRSRGGPAREGGPVGGQRYDPPRALLERLGRLHRAQKVMARQFRAREQQHAALAAAAKQRGATAPPLREAPCSRRLQAQIRRVARIHTQVARVREHHHRRLAATLDRRYRRFAGEEHGVRFMLRNRKQARSAADRGLHALKRTLASTLGGRYAPVPNRRAGIGGNSQTCVCGAAVPKALDERVRRCPSCGLVADRDLVSANICQLLGFGTVSPHLRSLDPDGGAPAVFPAAGQAVAGAEGPRTARAKARPSSRRGASARRPASEGPVKRRPPASRSTTAGGEPTAAGKTAVVERQRRSTDGVAGPLPAEPPGSKPARATARRRPGGDPPGPRPPEKEARRL